MGQASSSAKRQTTHPASTSVTTDPGVRSPWRILHSTSCSAAPSSNSFDLAWSVSICAMSSHNSYRAAITSLGSRSL